MKNEIGLSKDRKNIYYIGFINIIDNIEIE